MPIHTLSKGEWLAYFPDRPKAPGEPRFNPIDVNDLLHARFASVSVVVEVDKPWPGVAPLDDQNRIGKVQFSVGRWYIDDVAISNASISYFGIASYYKGSKKIYLADWLPDFISNASRTAHSVHDFLVQLRDYLYRDIPKEALATRASGFHVSTYIALASDEINRFMNTIFDFPNFVRPRTKEDYARYVLFKFDIMARIYKNWARKATVGTPIAVLVLDKNGVREYKPKSPR